MALLIKKPAVPAAASASASPAGAPSWFKRGDAIKEETEKEDVRAQKRSEDSRRRWRFRMKDNETATITFVDGHLTPAGVLDCFSFREHNVNVAGEWQQYVCVAENHEPCPICEKGKDFQSYLAYAFTIIDHREVKLAAKDGKPERIVSDQVRLFVCKRQTYKTLQQIATLQGGLAGCTFDVIRSGDQSASVGNNFMLQQKNGIEELKAHFMRETIDPKTKEKTIGTIFLPLDYEKEVVFKTAAELRALGFGGGTPIGAEKAVSDAKPAGADISKHL